jgi:SAM-dependent methyltransferase
MPSEGAAPPSRAWRDSFHARAYQAYLAGLKTHWGGELYRDVVTQATASGAKTPQQLEERMRGVPAYRLYGWLERRIQQFKWSGRWGFASLVDEQKAELQAHLDSVATDQSGRLQLDATLTLPEYVTATATHQQPGGLWQDAINAYVLAWYTTGLSFAGGDPNALVDWYAHLIRERCSEAGIAPRRIVDVGCTGGRSTRAIKRAIPTAELIGCDICAGPLRHGRLRTIEEDCDITLAQWRAEALKLPDASVDVLASHWLYHEMPPAAIRQSIAEARRVLRPGGLFVAYDMMLMPGGVIGQWLQTGYAARNNEPFAHTLTTFDFPAALQANGFVDIQLELTSPHARRQPMSADLPARRVHPMTFVSALVPRT